jgi:hypothetical protein
MRRLLAASLAVLLGASPALAWAKPNPPLPPEQWTAEAQLWLARAAVAEAGWEATLDHELIAFALRNQWRSRVQRNPELTFVSVVRSYCAGLGEEDAATPRQVWVRALPPVGDDSEPAGWPGRYAWRPHLKLWRSVQDRILRWGAGGVRDKSAGRVWHWGSPSPELPDIRYAAKAVSEGRWVLLNVGDTENSFYGKVR